MRKLVVILVLGVLVWRYGVAPRLAQSGPDLTGKWIEVGGMYGSMDLFADGAAITDLFGLGGGGQVGSYRVEGDKLRLVTGGRPRVGSGGGGLVVPFTLDGGNLQLELTGQTRRFQRQGNVRD
jgi:hypothetical protein